MRSLLRLQRTHSRKGSALIITMLLVTVIATVSFAISALTISEFRKTANLQDSVAAYYVAEGGIEHGLLEYRFWHDAQISQEYYKALHDNRLGDLNGLSPTANDGKPQRFTLDGKTKTTPTGQKIENLAGYVNDNDELGNSWYGLKMWYKGDRIGDLDSNSLPIIGNNSRLLSKDAALQFRVPSNAARAVVQWEPVNPILNAPGLGYFAEAITTRGSQTSRTVQAALGLSGSNGGKPNPNPLWSIPMNSGGFQATELRIKPWNMDAMRYSIIFQDGNHNIILNGLDTQRTYIEATGYSGKAKRQLRIGINRNAGNILESQDFLLYSGDSSLILQ